MTIIPGMLLKVRTASGEQVAMRALSAPERGRDFPIVWVCAEEEYDAALAGDDDARIPWPLDAVVDAVPA